jgi:hypothetical protein
MLAQYAQLREFSITEILPRQSGGPRTFLEPGTTNERVVRDLPPSARAPREHESLASLWRRGPDDTPGGGHAMIRKADFRDGPPWTTGLPNHWKRAGSSHLGAVRRRP